MNRSKYIIKAKPRVCFIQIGINDLMQKVNMVQTSDYCRQLIKELKVSLPETKIYFESVYPITEEFERVSEYGVNKKDVSKLNLVLKEMCKNEEIEYIDIFSKLVNSKGYLDSDKSCDTIHLNGNAYLIIKDELKKYLPNK